MHVSFLFGSESGVCQSPIVLTTPSKLDAPNLIVGSNLLEFLALGCVAGYDAVAELAWDQAGADRRMGQPGDPSRTESLAVLRNALRLEPWLSVEARLQTLQSQWRVDVY